jgi:hypothetical protein
MKISYGEVSRMPPVVVVRRVPAAGLSASRE